MTADHQALREALGAYVVGALDPAERRRVEHHLVDCRACTDELAELSALPGLLGRVSEQEASAQVLVPSAGLLDGVIDRLADDTRALHARLRRWRAAAVGAAAAAVLVAAAAVAFAAPWRSGPERTVATADPVVAAAQDTSGRAAAIAWEWGTTVELDLDDLPHRDDGYVLWAVAEDGRRERAGAWGVTSSGAAQVRGASSIDRSQLARVEVTGRDGTVLLSFDFSDPSPV
jgi:anti-sigma-K factor RskA